MALLKGALWTTAVLVICRDAPVPVSTEWLGTSPPGWLPHNSPYEIFGGYVEEREY